MQFVNFSRVKMIFIFSSENYANRFATSSQFTTFHQAAR
jgi:hypothetical protein